MVLMRGREKEKGFVENQSTRFCRKEVGQKLTDIILKKILKMANLNLSFKVLKNLRHFNLKKGSQEDHYSKKNIK